MVIHHHPSTPPDQRPPQLHRGQPIQVKVCERTAFEFYIHVSVAFLLPAVPSHWRASQRRYMNRPLVQEICEEREIVRREIPQDADVRLKQTEIEPHRVIVIDLSEFPGIDDLPQLPYGAGVYEGVIDHQDAAVF